MGPGVLSKALCGLKQPEYENLLVDYKHSDDAGVYKINDETALVQTVDFFPPIVDDPYTFGQIAAANALSDIYAMGGKPITAMSIVAFPDKKMDIEVLRQINAGGLSKLVEAGVALVGGHSITDEEVKYGLAVTGTVHPDKIKLNNSLSEGDVLILTKPIGNGILNTAMKGDMISSETISIAEKYMCQLNKVASEVAADFTIHACTDVTGFGLGGHICEMLDESDLGVEIMFNSLHLLPEVLDMAEMGMVPGGTYRNKEYRKEMVIDFEDTKAEYLDIVFDPQTSGGLIFAIPADEEDKLLEALKNSNIDAFKVGYCTNSFKGMKIV